MQDKIIVENLQVRNIIGVDTWERSKRQPILLTITVYTDVKEAGAHDLLSDTVNYGTLSKTVMEFSEASTYKSIESLAAGICVKCFDSFPSVGRLTVRVEKPKTLLHAKSAGVVITRLRSDESWLKGLTEAPATYLEHMKSDYVFVNSIEISALVGVNPWEREQQQRVACSLRFRPLLGHVNKAHNFRTISRVVQQCIEQSSFKTVEALATAVAKLCILQCGVDEIFVRIEKPSAILFADAAVIEIQRQRSDFTPQLSRDVNGNTLSTVFIALGSNIGDRAGNIHKALSLLTANGDVKLITTSYMYESAPQYVVDQAAFINAVCEVETSLDPVALLGFLKHIESEVGRTETFRYGPRVIDLDIILYDQLVLDTPQLQIPHPRLHEREFVLRPLCDIDPDLTHPKLFKSVNQLLNSVLKKSPSSVVQVTPVGNGRLLKFGQKTLMMGILNVTPDSFSDGGLYYDTDADKSGQQSLSKLLSILSTDTLDVEKILAVPQLQVESLSGKFRNHLKEAVQTMIDNDCDIVDVGGYSTRPGADEVSIEEELRRVIPVIQLIKQEFGGKILISVDTFKSAVAQCAVKCGANIVNDVTGGNGDKDMLSVVSQLQVPYVLMHSRGTPKTMMQLTDYSQYKSNESDLPAVVRGVAVELLQSVNAATNSGIYRWNIIIDPGVGFAKDAAQNMQLMKHLKSLRTCLSSDQHSVDAVIQSLIKFPMLVGSSRKRFISAITGKEGAQECVWGTSATCTVAIMNGADILRVHDVKEMRDVIKVSDSLYRQ
ncbi:hypothetical protein MP228_000520 [Amoeboaphelidium protococcarum]|nr:hypothetical protein MP228_000520 [Amoeboaphelidium protococcarum]